MAASKGRWSLAGVVITRDFSHTGHFGALTKLLKFRFETKTQIMFITNDGFDKPQQILPSRHFWPQPAGCTSNLSLFVFVLLLISVYLSVQVLKCWLKMCKYSWNMIW